MATNIFSCEEAKRTDLVDYLESLGHLPQKVRNNDYWYLSPFREEKKPSFKVNWKLNVWYDHGTGKGGNVVDFGILYHKCSVSEFLKLLNNPSNQFPFHQHDNKQASLNDADEKRRITIFDTRPILSLSLQHYLHSRLIPIDLANRYCREVDFMLYDKKYTAIGFQNNSGGYELRSRNFKGSSSPKDTTFIEENSEDLSVFEGFFSFLSYQTTSQNKEQPVTNFLILNSLAFFERCRSLMEKHEAIYLFLDRDMPGLNCTQKALTINNRYIDKSSLYQTHKDLNEWLMKESHGQRRSLKTGKHL